MLGQAINETVAVGWALPYELAWTVGRAHPTDGGFWE